MARINGNDSSDTLTGTNQDDVIRGGSGSDILYGNDGNDILMSGGSQTRIGELKTAFSDITFTIAQGWNNDRYPRRLADVNGDGMADIIGFGGGDVFTSLAKGDGTFDTPKVAITQNKSFTVQNGSWSSSDKYPRELADVNGDGMADIVAFSDANVEVALAKGDGTFSENRTALREGFTVEDGWQSNDRTPRRLADVNGDGRADIVGFAQDKIHVSFGRGNGTFSPAQSTVHSDFTSAFWFSNNSRPLELADVNGDGLADIVGFRDEGVGVALGLGNGSFSFFRRAANDFGIQQGWISNDRFPRRLADINGDGRADIVGFGKDSVLTALGQANGKFGPVQAKSYGLIQAGEWSSQSRNPRELADVNGDGIADIVGFGNSRVSVALMQEEDISPERLYGGAGDDLLNGGAGHNILNGGSGKDRFVLIQPTRNSVAYQVIEDFEQGVDKLDFKGAVRDLSFQRSGNDTLIKLSETGDTIARVQDAVIDSRDFVQAKAPALTPNQINDITALVEAWAQRYANSVDNAVAEVDLSNVEISQGDIVYEQKPIIATGEPKTASVTFRNSSSSNQSAQVTFGTDTNWQTSSTVSNTWKVGSKLATKAGFKIVSKASPNNTGVDVEGSGEISVEVNGEYGKTETKTNVMGGRSFDQTVFTTNAPANSVTTANITYSRQSFDSKFTVPVDITGTVKIDLQRGDNHDILDLPIGAILQYYNPSQFVSIARNNLTYRELPNGDYLAYSPTTRATVKGEVKGAVNVVGRQTVNTVIDHNLSNPASTPAAGYRGNQSNADRFWLALDGLPAGRQPVRILDFATNEDRLGIVAPDISRKADLRLSYDEDANIGRVGVGNRTLAELPGVDPRSLSASSFLFSTNGSIFDSDLPIASSSLKALPTAR